MDRGAWWATVSGVATNTHPKLSYSALKPPGNWRTKSFTKIAPVLGISPLSPSSNTGVGGPSLPALTHPHSRPAAVAGRAPTEGLGNSPGMSPRRGHRTRQREGLRAAVESASWAKGRGAGMETGAVGVGRTGSVAPGRRGTILAGCCWVGTPGVPDPLSMSRQGVE